jgi:hypothetical protein
MKSEAVVISSLESGGGLKEQVEVLDSDKAGMLIFL